MILASPIIFLENGISKYTISGIEGIEECAEKFKNNPLELAKLFRRENNKTLVIDVDNFENSKKLIAEIIKELDIPVQLIYRGELDKDQVIEFKKMGLMRIYSNSKFAIERNTFYVYPLFDFKEFKKIVENTESNELPVRSLVEVDFANAEELVNKLNELNVPDSIRIGVMGQKFTTDELIYLSKTQEKIDCIFLGEEYYGCNFAGQKLWRIVERELDCK